MSRVMLLYSQRVDKMRREDMLIVGSFAVVCGLMMLMGGCLFEALGGKYLYNYPESSYKIFMWFMKITPLLGSIVSVCGIVFVTKAVRASE